MPAGSRVDAQAAAAFGLRIRDTLIDSQILGVQVVYWIAVPFLLLACCSVVAYRCRRPSRRCAVCKVKPEMDFELSCNIGKCVSQTSMSSDVESGALATCVLRDAPAVASALSDGSSSFASFGSIIRPPAVVVAGVLLPSPTTSQSAGSTRSVSQVVWTGNLADSPLILKIKPSASTSLRVSPLGRAIAEHNASARASANGVIDDACDVIEWVPQRASTPSSSAAARPVSPI
jgi:hypothetical protein